MLVTLPVVLLLLDFWPLRRMQRTEGGWQKSEKAMSVECRVTGYETLRGEGAGPRVKVRGSRLEGQASRFQPSAFSLYLLLLEKLPFFVLAFLAGLSTLFAESKVGALPSVTRFTLAARFCNAILNGAKYLRETICPAGLTVFYPYPHSILIYPVLAAAVVLLAVSCLVLRSAWRRPYLVVGWLWYAVTLLPVSGVIQVGSHAAADRYTYVPLTGIFIMVAWGAAELFARWRISKAEAGVAAALVVGACATLTNRQLGYWQNTETLFRHALAVTRNNHIASNNLGAYYHQQGRVDDAMPLYQQAIRIAPDYADALNNLGYAFVNKNQYPEAVRCYESALQAVPKHIPARYNLGLALADLGKNEEAIPQFESVLQRKPDHVSARYHLGNVLATLGRTNEAIAQYKLVLQSKPDSADDLNNLGF
jgi:protein O-mannosyl-transferase